MLIDLIPVQRDGRFQAGSRTTAPQVPEVCEQQKQFYEIYGFVPPWIGYLVAWNRKIVGACAFKGGPAKKRVEIAYYIFPDFEGKGIATCAVQKLVQFALTHDPALKIMARTLPKHGPSTRVLEKNGFQIEEIVQDSEDGTVWEWSYVPS